MQRPVPAHGPSIRTAAIATVLSLGLLPWAPGQASAGDIASHLGAAIPSDVHLYSRWQRTAAQEPLFAVVRHAFRKLVASGILRDLRDLVTEGNIDAQGLERLQQIGAAIGAVPWRELASGEVAVGMRLRFPIPELVVLARVPAGRAAAQLDAMRSLFQRIVETAGPFLVASDITVLEHPGISLGVRDVPLAIDVVSRGDLLAFGFSRPLLASSLRLADGVPFDDERAIIDSERYHRILDGMRERRDAESIFDIAGYLGTFKAILGGLSAAAGNADPQAGAALDIATRLLGDLARFGTTATVSWSEVVAAGPHTPATSRVHEETRVLLGEGYKESSFFKTFLGREPLGDVLRVVPEKATGFFFTRGLDLAALHDRLVRTVEQRLPRGERLLERWSAIQDRIGFHLRDDLVSWLEGGVGWVTFPGEHGRCEWAAFVQVSDPELARQKLHAGFQRVARFLEGRSQSLQAEPVEGMPDELRALRIGAFPGCEVVAGVAGNHLIVASGVPAARIVAATFGGQRPHFKGTPGFDLGELLPQHPAHSLSYGDIEGQMEGLARLLSGVGFVASVLPRNHDSAPAIKLGEILTKLGAFIRNVDVGLQTATWTGIDSEQGVITTRRVTSFRAPRPGSYGAQPTGAEATPAEGKTREL